MAASALQIAGERLTSGSLLSIAMVVSTVTQLARVKIFAIVLGAAGMGFLAQVTSIQGLLLSTAPLFSGIALVSVLARSRVESEAARQEVIAAARLLALTVSVASVAVAASALASLGNAAAPLPALILIAAAGVPFGAVANVEQSGLQESRRFPLLALVQASAALVSVVAIGLLTAVLGLTGAAAGIGLSLFVAWAVTVALSGSRALRFVFAPTIWRSVASLGAGALGASVLASLAEVALRVAALARFGAEGAGIAHVLLTLTLQLSLLVGAALTSYSTARISGYAARGDLASIRAEIEVARRLATLVGGAAILFLSGMREPFVEIFLSTEFSAVAILMPVFLLGQLLRLQSWTVGQYMLPLGHRASYVAVVPIFYATFLLIMIGAAPVLGLAVIAVAEVSAAAATAAFVLGHARRSIRYVGGGARNAFMLVLVGMIAGLFVPVVSIAAGIICMSLGLRPLLERARSSRG